MPETQPAANQKTIRLERFYDAPVDSVWELWTTKAGFESWWGPAGFSTEVTAIDVRVGGRIVYRMSAVDPAVRKFVEDQGTPVTTESVLSIRELVPGRRLVFTNVVDFLPGIPEYELGIAVEMSAAAAGTHLVVTLDRMHDQHWTELAVKGWESQLENLARVVASR